MSQRRVLVVGLGHPYRGDDGIGVRAAEEFEAMNADETVAVMATQELLPELAETISHVDLLVFLDARANGEPGSIEISEIKPAEAASGVFLHTLTMENLVSTAGTLFGHAPKTMLISVAGESFDFSPHLTPKIEATIPRMITRLREVIGSV